MPNNTPKQPTHKEWDKRIEEILGKFADYIECDEWHIHTNDPIDQIEANADPNDGHMDFDEHKAKQAINVAVLELVIGEDEDLNAPLNREIDDNPETDKYPLLYVVRRAVRNVFRAKQRQAITGKSNQL